MDLIRELTLVQQSAAGAAGVLVLVSALVMMRRRSTATKKSADASSPAERRKRRRRAPKAEKAPHRRRKLAAEAAQAMGTQATLQLGADIESPVAAPAAEISVPPVPTPPPAPIAVAEPVVEADESGMEAQERIPVGAAVAAATVSDPYVSPVAQPGWPSPGELASGFDPDDFDPLPDAADHLPEPPAMIEPPVDADPAADESADPADDLWDDNDDFDPATGWSEDEAPTPAQEPVIDVWAGDGEDTAADVEVLTAPIAIDETKPIDLEALWDDADEGPLDTADRVTDQFELPEEVVIEDELALEIEPVADEVHDEPPAEIEIDALPDFAGDGERDETAMEWVEPEAAAEEAVDELAVPYPAPGSIPAHEAAALVRSPEASTGPIVLDLASLASVGQAVELVIEPGVDGNGVRVRIGSPVAHTLAGDLTAAAAEELASEPTADPVDAEAAVEQVNLMDWAFTNDDAAAEPADDLAEGLTDSDGPATVEVDSETFDVPFLTGGGGAFVAPSPGVVLPDFSEEDGEEGTDVDVTYESAPVETDEAAGSTEVAAPDDIANADDDFLEDPVQILADIRARLAALDARRGGV